MQINQEGENFTRISSHLDLFFQLKENEKYENASEQNSTHIIEFRMNNLL